MSISERIPNYREFWKFYVGEHSDPTCRRLHFVGTGLTLASALAGVIISPGWFLAMPISGYSFAWLGHFGFEKNRPATFKHPFWSLMADFHMFGMILAGRMSGEVEKYAKPR